MTVEVTISTGEVLTWYYVTRICKLTPVKLSLRYMDPDGVERSFRYDFSKLYPEDRIMTVHIYPTLQTRPTYFNSYFYDDGETTLNDYRERMGYKND